jgi:hypothetical protein
VVIATVFLTIIGGTVGFMLGEQHRDDESGDGPQPTTTTQTTAAAPATTGPQCPPEASATAGELGFPSELAQVLKVVTDRGTTVWICRDPDGGLYYQSKTGGVEAALVQGENGLFLSGVVDNGDDQYDAVAVSVNPKTKAQERTAIKISRKRLQVNFPSGKVQNDAVVEAD